MKYLICLLISSTAYAADYDVSFVHIDKREAVEITYNGCVSIFFTDKIKVEDLTFDNLHTMVLMARSRSLHNCPKQ